MSKPYKLTPHDLRAISEHATALETQAIDALLKYRTYDSAAASLDLTKVALRGRVREAARRAAKRGAIVPQLPPVRAPLPIMPEGQRLKGNSTLVGADGTVSQQWAKTERDSDEPKFEPIPAGHHVKKVSTLLDSQGEVRAQWVQSDPDAVEREAQFWSAARAHVEAYRGLAEPAPNDPQSSDFTFTDRCLSMYPLGDPHIGMFSWARETGVNFDLKIAERELIAVVDQLVEYAPATREAMIVNVGDFFHADDEKQITPGHGHKLDVEGRYAKVAEIGFAIMRRLVDLALRKHEKVQVYNVPGNHDPKMSRMLSLWLGAVYEREPRVEIVPNTNPYMYRTFGSNLWGITHGEGPKPADLPEIMAADVPALWGASKHRLWITGHVHHESRKEYRGATVETFRTLAARDAWHHWKGYRSGRSLNQITFDREFGEVSRNTVDLRRVIEAAQQ